MDFGAEDISHDVFQSEYPLWGCPQTLDTTQYDLLSGIAAAIFPTLLPDDLTV